MRVVLVVSALLAVALAVPTNCKGSPNKNAPWTGEPTFLKKGTNGQLFSIGEGDNVVKLLHVYGTPYEMGKAHGELLKEDILALFHEFYEWLDAQMDQYLPFLPKPIRHAFENGGARAALQLTEDLVHPFTPDHFTQEMAGLADGLGQNVKEVVRIQMFPELIKAACSIVGAWGPATGAGLVQLRALDWGVDNPMRLHPTVVVYHPTQGGVPFSILTFSGFIGALTGYGTNTGVCEKVWIHSNETLLEGRRGVPWHFLLRDILQFDSTLGEAVHRMQSSKRTASIFVGVGSQHDGEARIAEYKYDSLDVFGDTTPFPGYEPSPVEHPIFPGMVYADKHSQPSHDPCSASLLKDMYGKVSASEFIVNFVSMVQTGDLHIGVYDYDANFMYIAVASQTDVKTIIPAHDRQFLALNMTALLNHRN